MNDVIRHVGSMFCVNKFVALVTFAGRNIINVSGGEERQNKLYFPLGSCETVSVVCAQNPQNRSIGDLRGFTVLWYISLYRTRGKVREGFTKHTYI